MRKAFHWGLIDQIVVGYQKVGFHFLKVECGVKFSQLVQNRIVTARAAALEKKVAQNLRVKVQIVDFHSEVHAWDVFAYSVEACIHGSIHGLFYEMNYMFF